MSTVPIVLAIGLILAFLPLWSMSTINRLNASQQQRYKTKTRTPFWQWVLLCGLLLAHYFAGSVGGLIIAAIVGGYVIWGLVDTHQKIRSCGFTRRIRKR